MLAMLPSLLPQLADRPSCVARLQYALRGLGQRSASGAGGGAGAPAALRVHLGLEGALDSVRKVPAVFEVFTAPACGVSCRCRAA
jgi:hypothetical protein